MSIAEISNGNMKKIYKLEMGTEFEQRDDLNQTYIWDASIYLRLFISISTIIPVVIVKGQFQLTNYFSIKKQYYYESSDFFNSY